MAEKFQAMVKLGVLNSRMKDFYDIWVLSRTFDFTGAVLADAIEKTFEKRSTPVTLDTALFTPSFGRDGDKNAQWQSFISKTKLINAPSPSRKSLALLNYFSDLLQPRLLNGERLIATGPPPDHGGDPPLFWLLDLK